MIRSDRSQDSAGNPMIDRLSQGTPDGSRLQIPSGNEPEFFRIFKPTRSSGFSFPVKLLSSSASPESIDTVSLYKPGIVSLGQIAEMSGLFYDETIQEVVKRGKHLDFGPETSDEAHQELELVEKYMRKQ